MLTAEEEKLQESDPVSEGRAPTRAEEEADREREEKDVEERVQTLRAKASELAASLPDDPEVQEAVSRLQGDPKQINPQELERIASTVREKEAQQNQKTLMMGALTIAGIGAVMAMMGVSSDGRDYPRELAGTDELPRSQGLPVRQQESHSRNFS